MPSADFCVAIGIPRGIPSLESETQRRPVDMDLEKFFDRVHHDRLVARLAERIGDQLLLKLIRGFLTSGVLANGLVSPTTEARHKVGLFRPC